MGATTQFLKHDGRDFFRQVVTIHDDFVPPFDGSPYPCLLWTHAAPLAPPTRESLAGRLVSSQCRYAVCAGHDCEALHDEIDSAYIRPLLDPSTWDVARPLVMTTWHDHETFAEVAEFFVLATNFDEHDFRRYLVVHIGGSPTEHATLESEVRRVAIGADAV